MRICELLPKRRRVPRYSASPLSSPVPGHIDERRCSGWDSREGKYGSRPLQIGASDWIKSCIPVSMAGPDRPPAARLPSVAVPQASEPHNAL